MNNKKELIKSLNENVDNSLEEVIDYKSYTP